MYINDMDKRLARYEEYWNLKNHDRPLLNITAPKKIIREDRLFDLVMHNDQRANWWDNELVLKQHRNSMERTYYAGEAFPALNPNLGPDFFAATLGAEMEYAPSTSWAINFVEKWSDHKFVFDENNKFWRKLVEMTNYFLDHSHGDYIVGVTDIHQGMDALVSMRGAENVCLDLYDDPEGVLRTLKDVEVAYKEVLYRSYDMILAKQKGMTSWMGIYHPDKWYISSSDFIYLVSPPIFDEFCRNSIQSESLIIGNNIFHLDGIGSLTHLDSLLEMPEINGIQWVYGDGQPTAAHWVDVLKRIQSAGKMIHILCTTSDLDVLLNCGLKPEGVFYVLRCGSEEEADMTVKRVTDAYK